MKFLVDENLSNRLVLLIEKSYPDTIHVSQIGLVKPSEDLEIWHFALKNHFVVLTQDKDFYHISQMKGFPPKIVLLHAWNSKTLEIANRLNSDKDKILEKLTLSEVGVLEIFF